MIALGNQRLLNMVIGLNVMAWAVLGMALSEPADRWTAVRISVSLLNALVGVLFLVRRPLLRAGSWKACLLAFPSFVAGGLAFRLSPPLAHWPTYAQIAFTVATAMTGVSLLALGRSFAVLPADRGTIRHGPYSLVRHPAYACELAMIVACFLAGPSPWAAIPLAVAVPCIAVRLLAEERLLEKSPAYRTYAAAVRWRLLPGIW